MAKETFATQEDREKRLSELQSDPNVFCVWTEDSDNNYHVCWEPELEGTEDI
jgi:hypothetical protein